MMSVFADISSYQGVGLSPPQEPWKDSWKKKVKIVNTLYSNKLIFLLKNVSKW